MWLPLNWLVAEFVIGLSTTWYIIPRLKTMFLKKGISGKDMSKNYKNVNEANIPKIPEAQVRLDITINCLLAFYTLKIDQPHYFCYHIFLFQGVITGCIFLILTIMMIPFTLVNEDGTSFITSNSPDAENVQELQQLFPHLLSTFRQLLQLGMALLSICCMVLLGFTRILIAFVQNIASIPM